MALMDTLLVGTGLLRHPPVRDPDLSGDPPGPPAILAVFQVPTPRVNRGLLVVDGLFVLRLRWTDSGSEAGLRPSEIERTETTADLGLWPGPAAAGG